MRVFLLQNRIVLILLLFITTASQLFYAQGKFLLEPAKVSTNSDLVILKNSFVSINMNIKTNRYSIIDERNGTIVLKDAVFSFDGWNNKVLSQSMLDNRLTISYNHFNIKRNAINGKRLELYFRVTSRELPDYMFAIDLFDNSAYLTMQAGIKNTLKFPCRFVKSDLFNGAILFPGCEVSNLMTLNGAAGVTMPEVNGDITRQSNNNMLITAKVNGGRKSVVFGGLKYDSYFASTSYARDIKTNERSITLSMNDPIGRLIDVDEKWWAPDTYFLSISDDNPFEALENYGKELGNANNAKPNSYDFITLCGWAVGSLSKGKNINNSVELINQLDEANKCGITNYTKIAVRLEPDVYCYKDGNTQQGWWDDEHWSKFGHLKAPYDTFSKWCEAVRQRNGIPFTYFQSNMPSDDFAKKYPDWMLNENVSLLNQFHRHHQPYVRFDYTDSLFRNHVKNVWKRLRNDGMVGIKFDYPETAWCPNGGFDNKKATTTSVYRDVFKLCREGLGPNARIHERALGESGAPTLDVCAGIIDIQRNAQDNNKFETNYVTSSGLRWYKAGNVFSYYPDSKAIHIHNSNVRKALLTMMAFTTGRLELATPFEMLTPEMVHDISRIYPYYSGNLRARPLDAFTGIKNPQLYDLALTSDWHQVALFNGETKRKDLVLSLAGSCEDGGLGLFPNTDFYIYDFWKDSFVGKVNSSKTISVPLDSMNCALYSIRKVQSYPQILSTNRHILQGWLDTKNVNWDKKIKNLNGVASVIKNEPFKLVVASNGFILKSVKADGAMIRVEEYKDNKDLKQVIIESKESKDINWSIFYR